MYSSQQTSNKTDEELADYTYKVLAREAAVTGLNLTVRKLVADTDNWMTGSYGFSNEPYHNANFTVVVTPIDPDTADVVATGTDGTGTQVIDARYAIAYNTIAVPPSFKFAIISDENLTLNGQAEIQAVDDGSNANIHANGDLTSNGSQVTVEGYGSFDEDGGGSGSVNPEKAIDDIFDPNVDGGYDPDEQPDNLIEGENIEIPALDPTEYDEVGESDVVMGGDYSFGDEVIDFQTWADTSAAVADGRGTATDPFRLYVHGNLTITGDVTLLGYVQIVTFGSISISGNVTSSVIPVPPKGATEAEWDAYEAANLDAAGNTKIGWYSNTDISVSGNSTVVGQLYANETIDLNGGGGQDMNIIGGVTSTDVDINVNGGIVIRYAEISEKVVIPGFVKIVPEGVRLIAWAEW